MAADYPDWGALAALQTFITDLNLASSTLQATAAEIAAEIAATGIPLLGNPIQQYDTAGPVTIAAHPSVETVTDVNGKAQSPMSGYLSYDMSFALEGNASSAGPFCEVIFSWYADSAGANLLYEEVWVIPMSSGTASTVWGTGPVRGAYLQVVMISQDATYTATLTNFLLYGNSRPAPESTADWRMNLNGATVPGFTTPSAGRNFDGMIGYFSGTLAASDTVSLMCSLAFGQLFMGVECSGTSPALTVQPQAFLAGSGQVITGQSATYDASPGSLYVNAIRSPTILALTNTNAADSVTYKIALVAVKTA